MYNAFTWKKRVVVVGLLLMVFACMPRVILGQDIEIDWASNSDKPDSYPALVNREQIFTVRVKNVNDILYTYTITHTSVPLPPDSFSEISKLIGLALQTNRALGACKPLTELQGLDKQINDSPALAPKVWEDYLKNPSKPPRSVPLQQTRDAWTPIWAEISKLGRDAADNDDTCSPADQEQYKKIYDLAKAIQDRAMLEHVLTDSARIGPDTSNTFTIREYFKGIETKTKTVQFQTGSNRLVLSAGALFSRVPDRSYESRKTPASTENVLVVEGNSSFRPEGVALLNYTLPIPRLDGDTAGVAVSAGPVVRFGSNNDTAGLGFFLGLSGQLYRNFYFTPGFHFGQFADFPVGFSNGSTIPANFGELNPVKRWTSRFAFAISFRTKSFSNLGKSQEPPKVATETGKPTPTPSPTSRNNFIDFNVNASLAAHGLIADIPRFELPGVTDALPPSDPRPTLRSINSLSSTNVPGGASISLNASTALNDYAVSSNGIQFSVIIPHTRLATDQLISSVRGLTNIEIKQRGDDLVLIFTLSPGMRAYARERANSLDIILSPLGR